MDILAVAKNCAKSEGFQSSEYIFLFFKTHQLSAILTIV